MAESSRFWNSNDVGDGLSSGYTAAQIGAWMQALFGRGGSGILARVLNELAVSGTASPLSVATGAAIVDGHFYTNDAALSVAVASPTTGTTGGRVVLEADWSAQTVRAKAIKSADGTADIPELTQTSGTLYQISLATFTITTGGVIGALTLETGRASFGNSQRVDMFGLAAGLSVIGRSASTTGAAGEITAGTDYYVMRRSGSSIGFGQIAAAGIFPAAVTEDKLASGQIVAEGNIINSVVELAKLAADSVDDTKLGNRVPQFYRRQGGSSSVWSTAGSSNYTPGTVRILAGVTSIEITSGFGKSATITLPVALSNPIVFASIQALSPTPGGNQNFSAEIVVASSTTLTISARQDNSWITDYTLTIAWMAIGPEA